MSRISLFMFVTLAATAANASTVTLGPVDTNVKDWQSTSVAKLFDGDLNNAYGTLGEGWWGSSANNTGFAGTPPSWATIGTSSTTLPLFVFGPWNNVVPSGYGAIDNPSVPAAPVVADVLSGIIGTTTSTAASGNLFEFQVTGAPPVGPVRVGIALNGGPEVPTTITLASYNSSPLFLNSFATHTIPATPGYDSPDFYFFDVSGLYTGEWLVISATTRQLNPTSHNAYISGVTFDAIVPEPTSLSMLLCGALGMFFVRKRS